MGSPTGKKHIWTEAEDDLIREGRSRAVPVSWDVLGAAIGIHRQGVMDRARNALGIRGHHKPPKIEEEPDEGFDRRREALPAGSHTSWSAITSGTLLDGVAYPL